MRTTRAMTLMLGLLMAGATGIGTAGAAPPVSKPTGPAGSPLVEQADYLYRGRNYCWYYDGWQGPGWYWCGYAWRRGYGWGSPVWGWNNWAWSGPRYYRGGPGYHGRPVYRGGSAYRGGSGHYGGRPGHYGGHNRH